MSENSEKRPLEYREGAVFKCVLSTIQKKQRQSISLLSYMTEKPQILPSENH